MIRPAFKNHLNIINKAVCQYILNIQIFANKMPSVQYFLYKVLFYFYHRLFSSIWSIFSFWLFASFFLVLYHFVFFSFFHTYFCLNMMHQTYNKLCRIEKVLKNSFSFISISVNIVVLEASSFPFVEMTSWVSVNTH